MQAPTTSSASRRLPARRRARCVTALVAALALAPLRAHAALSLPAILGDHMVLQRGDPVVWGWAEPGRTITVDLAGRRASAVAGSDGRFSVALHDVAAGGPYAMTVAGDGARTVDDVLVGDVWLAAGQSNMEMSVASSDVALPQGAAECARLRLFSVPDVAAPTPVDDTAGRWQRCTPESVRDFSAVAFAFARALGASVPVPLGMIVAAWGSTAADVWTPATPADGAALPAVKHGAADTALPFALEVADLRLVPRDARGAPLPIRLSGGGEGLGGRWEAHAEPGSTATYEVVGGPRGAVSARFAGTLVSSAARARVRTPLRSGGGSADLTPYASIAFRARGSGGFRLGLDRPTIVTSLIARVKAFVARTTGLARTSSPGDYLSQPFTVDGRWRTVTIPLDTLLPRGWGAPRTLVPDAVDALSFGVAPQPPQAQGSAYNAMVAPLTPLRLSGVLWYQGEGDAGHASRYRYLLGRMIAGWRAAWRRDDLPFLIVQLPGFADATPGNPATDTWAQLREAQLAILDVPDTAVVTTIDLGAAHDMHPHRKAEVGRRLALAARRLVYREPVLASGPRLESASAVAPGARLRFADVGTGLVTADGAPLAGFVLSPDGHRFAPASARIVDPATVEVWSDQVPRPLEVRYGWADDPTCNLANGDGLPASPFRVELSGAAAPDAPR